MEDNNQYSSQTRNDSSSHYHHDPKALLIYQSSRNPPNVNQVLPTMLPPITGGSSRQSLKRRPNSYNEVKRQVDVHTLNRK